MAKHGKIKDSGANFVIDPISRKVIVPHVHKSIGTVGDHNSEQITFMCPQIIDGHDVSQCESRYVTWVNANGISGHDELKISQVEQGAEGMIYLSWTIRNGLTATQGIIKFSVHFEDKDENNATSYRWSTTTCKDCDILDSINAVLGAYEAVYVSGDALVFADYNAVKDGTLRLDTNGLIPQGTMEITENGKYEVGRFAEVDVAVSAEIPEITIDENGKITAEANGVSSELQLDAPEITISDQGIVTAEANGVKSEFELDAPTVTVTNSGYAKATSHGKETLLLLGKPSINILDSGSVKAIANNLVESVKLSAEHDPHFLPENIRKGVNIFGVTGSYDYDPLPLVSGTITDTNRDNDVGIVVYYSGYSKTLGESYGVLKDNWYAFTGGSLITKFVKDLPIIIMPSLGARYPLEGVQQSGRTIELIGDVKLVESACDGSLFVVRPTGDNFEVRVPMTPAVG